MNNFKLAFILLIVVFSIFFSFSVVISTRNMVPSSMLNILVENLDNERNPSQEGQIKQKISQTSSWPKPFVTHFYQGSNTTFTLSWDDARLYDTFLAPIDEKYGIKHTIFSPSFRSYPNRSFWRYTFLIDELFQGHDVQSHSGEHLHLSDYNSSEQERYVKWGKTGIEELFGFTPLVYAYPYGNTGGSAFVKTYFKLGRTINYEGTSWPPNNWNLAGNTISGSGINDNKLSSIVTTMKQIYHQPGFKVFKGYGHTNAEGRTYGVTNWVQYENVISQIAGWKNVWYTSWGELVAYTEEKSHVLITDPIYFQDTITFNVSAPTLNTLIYNVPITISVPIPNTWINPVPSINGTYTSKFSLKEYPNNYNALLLDIIPSQNSQNVTISRITPYLDTTPPEISNFKLETRMVNQSWKLSNSEILKYTFMRFDVNDSQTNVHHVNASIHLLNGTIWNYSNIQNPIFWQNSTYGRVVWNSSRINNGIPQINKNEVNFTVITALDGFGNTRISQIFMDGSRQEQIIEGNGSLLRFPDKDKIPHKINDFMISSPLPHNGPFNETISIAWEDADDSWNHNVFYEVYYSPNDGEEWFLISSNVTTNSTTWNTTEVSDGVSYSIKVISNCTEGELKTVLTNIFSISNNPHPLTKPMLDSQQLPTTLNDTITLNWTNAIDSYGHQVYYSLYYSKDQGDNWQLFVSDLINRSYEWDTQQVSDDSNYLIKVVAECSSDYSAESSLIGPYSIRNSLHVVKKPQIFSPFEGRIYEKRIRVSWYRSTDSWEKWNHSVSYTILLSSDNGSSWNVLEENLIATSYFLAISPLKSGYYIIRVLTQCSEGVDNYDTSAIFYIQNSKHHLSKPRIISPIENSTLRKNVTIKWTLSEDSLGYEVKYTLSYSPDNGTSWNVLEENLETLRYNWDTTILPNGNEYLIKLIAISSGGLEEETTTNFSITIVNRTNGWKYLQILPIFVVIVLIRKRKCS